MRREQVFLTCCLLFQVSGAFDLSCCQEDLSYSAELGQCLPANLTDEFNDATPTPSADMLPIDCSDGYRLRNTSVSDFAASWTDASSADQFCADTTSNGETVVFFCQQQQGAQIAVKKCCPMGYAVHGESIGQTDNQCVAINASAEQNFYETFDAYRRKLRPNFMLPNYSSLDIVTDPSRGMRISLECPMDYNQFMPSIFADNFFDVRPKLSPAASGTPSSQLYVPAGYYSMFRNITGDYCIDNMVDPEGNLSVRRISGQFFTFLSYIFSH